MKSRQGEPSLDDCNEFLDWIEENNDIDLNAVRFRIRQNEGDDFYLISCEWRFRSKAKPPRASDLLLKPGWMIDKWSWNGEAWISWLWHSIE